MARMVVVKSGSKSTTAVETAQYINGMAKELRVLATNSELGFLAYLLSMVEQEAASIAGGSEEVVATRKSGAA